MSLKKEIIVVAPDKYKDLARKISHEIAKIPGCNGAFWSVKQFENNEFQLGGGRYAVFIGSSKENSLTKDYLPVIDNLRNYAGACFGFDGTKAVVFGNGDLEQAKNFKKVKEKTLRTLKSSSTIGASIALSTITFSPLVWIIFPSHMLAKLLIRKKRENELRVEQTNVALSQFLEEYFGEWIGMDK